MTWADPWYYQVSRPFFVSPNGIANDMASIPNAGADFGPDSPGTQTGGWEEAFNALAPNVFSWGGQNIASRAIYGLPGIHKIYQTIPKPDFAMDIGGAGPLTVLQAQTSGMTIMKLVTGASDYIVGDYIHDLSFSANGIAATGLDMTQTSPQAANQAYFVNLRFSNGFSTWKMILDNWSDTYVIRCVFGYITPSAEYGLHWFSAGSNGYVSQSHFFDAYGLDVELQQIKADQCYFGGAHIAETLDSLWDSCYWVGAGYGGYSVPDLLVGGYCGQIEFDNCQLSCYANRDVIDGQASYVDKLIFKNCWTSVLFSGASHAYICGGGFTETLMEAEWDMTLSTTTPLTGTNFGAPFGYQQTLAGGNNYISVGFGFDYATPAIPASGTAVVNNFSTSGRFNGKPVRIYLTAINNLTAITITDVLGNSETFTATFHIGDYFDLKPFESITLTYGTTAPQWLWYGL